MADRNAVSTSGTPAGVCPGSPNRALWRSLTNLTSENAELKVKVATLERTSASAIGSGSSKFLKMELDKERAEARALREQLATAALERAALQAQLDACQERLVAAEVDGARLGEQLAEARGAAQHAAQQLEAKDAELQALSSALMGCKEQLAAKEAALAVAEAEAAVARAGLQDVCAKGEAAQAKLRSEVARLEAAQQAHLAAVAGLEQQLAQAAAQVEAAQAAAQAAQAQAQAQAQQLAHAPGVDAGSASGPASPISLGVASVAAASPEDPGDQGVLGGASGAATPSGQAPLGLQSGIVYNVMPLVDSPRLDPMAAQEQERLTQQVLSLQDKLDTLQLAYEKLTHDYSCVTEQLAARQAEVQLARLSPESTQLKQQVAQLQTQVATLQQELFHAHLQQVSLPEEGGGPPAREGRSLKRSFTRAASMIGQRMGLRRPKSSASLEPCSRGSSMTESVASHSASASPYGATSLGPPDASPRASPTPRGGLAPAHLELLHLRQVLQEREAAVQGLEERLAGEERRQAALQEALLQQGQELGGQLEEARVVLARKQAELEVAESAARQLLEVQGAVPAEVPMPGSGEHAKCREAVQSLFKQVWKERIARQKAEFRLEQRQQQQLSASQSRRSTVSGVDDAALERLQAEALAADTMATELQKAKAHQLMLQQRLEALHLQLAKQTQALESASRVSCSGRPSPRAPRGPPSPSRDAIAQHLLLKAAQQRCHEVELRLMCAERDLEKYRRRERELNAALAQAAEWRKGAEKQHTQDKEGWRKRWERERTAVVQISGRLHATAVAQHELLSGLEVLQALLRKRSAAEGSPASGRPGRAASRSSDTQEGLKQISALLRTASTHLQILSPQQSDCLGSPRGEHVALSYPAGTSLPAPTASAGAAAPVWQSKIHTWLAEPAEPASPRLGAREEPSSSARQQAPTPAPEAQPAATSAAAAGGSAIDHVLQMILEPADEGSEQLSTSSELAPPAPAGAGLGSAPLEGARSGGIASLRRDSSGRSEQLLDLPEGSVRLNEDSSAMRAGDDGAVGRPTSTQDSDTIPAVPAGGNPHALATTAGVPASTVQHSPVGHTSTSTPRSSAAAKQGLGVQWAGQQPKSAAAPDRSSSPKIKALASKISSGFRKMGVACKETATFSGATTPAGAKPSPSSANASSRVGSPVKRTGTAPPKPRKREMWL